MSNLENICIMVTRPKPQGEELCARIRACHGNAIYFPVIDIVPPSDPSVLEQQIIEMKNYDWLIFISPQAVLRSAGLIQTHWSRFPVSVNVAAIGAGTAQALNEARIPVMCYPKGDWSSDGLLRMQEFRVVSGKRIAIVCGGEGRGQLEDDLVSRGAEVTHFIAYRRSLPDHIDVAPYLDLLRDRKIDAIVCTSGEGLRNLVRLLGETARPFLQHTPLIVVSRRLVDLAGELNFNQVYLAENASHIAVMKMLVMIRDLSKRKLS